MSSAPLVTVRLEMVDGREVIIHAEDYSGAICDTLHDNVIRRVHVLATKVIKKESFEQRLSVERIA